MAIYSGFTHWTWWFSIVMLIYQRVKDDLIYVLHTKNGDFQYMKLPECTTFQYSIKPNQSWYILIPRGCGSNPSVAPLLFMHRLPGSRFFHPWCHKQGGHSHPWISAIVMWREGYLDFDQPITTIVAFQNRLRWCSHIFPSKKNRVWHIQWHLKICLRLFKIFRQPVALPRTLHGTGPHSSNI